MTVDGGPRDWRRELVVPLVDVLVKVLLVHQPVQVEEAGLPDEGEDDELERERGEACEIVRSKYFPDRPTSNAKCNGGLDTTCPPAT